MQQRFLSKLAFWQKSHSSAKVGIYIDADEITAYQGGESPSLIKIPLIKQDWQLAFATLAAQISRANLHIVLSDCYYQLLLVDKPPVADEEMGQALLWSIKDMVAKPVNELHLDYFEAPQSRSNKLTVVVVERAMLSALALAAKQHEITIAGIGIEEIAISNYQVSDSQARLVLCHTPNSDLMLAVIKQGQLFMQRSVRGFNQINTVSAADLRLEIADNLSIELQRSMDYFESQFRQAPVASIDLLMEGDRNELAHLLSANFDQKVEVIPCERVADKLAEFAYAEFSRNAQPEEA